MNSNQPLEENILIKKLDERLGFSSFAYPIPKHANSILYMLGGLTLFCFILLISTGIFLSQFYNPDPLKAHDSVIYIMTKVPFGAYIRGVHHWSSNIVIVLLLLHLLRVFIAGSYKKPREATWLTGVVLLIITVAFIFTGTVLKWDQEAVEALSHNEAVGSILGALGSILISSFTQSTSMLARLYSAHISILLIFFGILLLLHFYLIKRHGIAPKAVYGAIAQKTKGLGNAKFSQHILKLMGYGFITYSIIGIFALLFPAPVGYPGVAGAEITKPPWFFLPLYAIENFFGIEALLWAPIAFVIALVAIPFVDRNQWLSPFRRKLVVGIGLLLFLLLIILGIYAWLTPATKHIMGADAQSVNKSFSLIPKAQAHGGAVEVPSGDMEMPGMEAKADAMNLELDQSLSNKAIILSTILISLQIGLIILKEASVHE